jgi:hypothetical protein
VFNTVFFSCTHCRASAPAPPPQVTWAQPEDSPVVAGGGPYFRCIGCHDVIPEEPCRHNPAAHKLLCDSCHQQRLVDKEWAVAEQTEDQRLIDTHLREQAALDEEPMEVGQRWFWHRPRSVTQVDILSVRWREGRIVGAEVRTIAGASTTPSRRHQLSIVRLVPMRELSRVPVKDEQADEDAVEELWPTVPGAGDTMPQTIPPVSVGDAAMITNARVAASDEERLVAVTTRFNTLLQRPAVDVRSLLRPVPVDCPAAVSSLADLFGPCANNEFGGAEITTSQGSWARRYLARLPPDPWGQAVTRHRWSPEQVQEQVELLVRTNNNDMRMQLAKEQYGRAGTHRCMGGELRLRARDMKGAGQAVFDFRYYGECVAAGSTPPPLCVPQLDEAHEAGTSWDGVELRRRFEAAGLTDEFGLQQLTGLGVVSGFDTDRPRDLMLMQNGSGVGRVPGRIAQGLADEEEKGMLSKAHSYLIFCPCATTRCSTVAKDGVPDKRIVFDFEQFRSEADGGGQFSINAGLARFDEELLRPLVLMTVKQFALAVGVLQLAAGNVWVSKTDFQHFYRQLRKPTHEWWFQIIWASWHGMRIDYCQTFGDGSGPQSCHVAADIYVNLVWWEFEEQLRRITASEWSAEEYTHFGATQKQILRAVEKMQELMSRRAAALAARFPGKSPEWIADQCRQAAIGGFFDDTMSASLRLLLNLCVRAKLRVAAAISAPIALHKTFVGSHDNMVGVLDGAFFEETGFVRWKDWRKGCMEALGVEMRLAESQLQVSDARLDSTVAAIDSMVERSSIWKVGKPGSVRQDRRVTPVSAGGSAVGKSGFNVGFTPAAKGLLAYAYKCLRVANTIDIAMNAKYRADPSRFRGGEPVFAKMFFSAELEAMLRECVSVCRQRGGVSFCPMQSAPGTGGRRTAWVVADAAGFRHGVSDMAEQGGGGAWIVDVTAARAAFTAATPMPVQWFYRAWTPAELVLFSTFLEAANATQILPLVANQGFEDVIIALDNESWVLAGRKLSCRSEDLVAAVEDLARAIDALPGVRVFLVFHHRERGVEADALSKAYILHKDGLHGLEWASTALATRGFAELTDENRLRGQ